MSKYSIKPTRLNKHYVIYVSLSKIVCKVPAYISNLFRDEFETEINVCTAFDICTLDFMSSVHV